jgi:hypothetical protein
MEASIKQTAETRPVSAFAAGAALLALISAAAVLPLLAALHFLKPDLDPSWRMISEYALGEHGWVMTLCFLAWGLSGVGLFAALGSQARTVAGRIGLGFLLVGAAGPILSAVFPMDPLQTPADSVTTSGALHSLGAALSDGIPIAALLLSLSLWRRNPGWKPMRRPLLWATVLLWVGTLALTVSMAVLLPRHGGRLGPEIPVGWQGRFVVLTHCAWLMTAAWCARRVRDGSVRAEG